jgi:predicted lipase|tara:strand:+ start:473 stop:1369 length:897 start_codon:yes stop_codon:yes gene_type:complete
MEIKMNLKAHDFFIKISAMLTALLMSTLTQAAVTSHVDFDEIHQFAELSHDAYKSNEEINIKYGKSVFTLNALPKYDGSYFILKDEANKMLTISIRGTANFENSVIDGEFLKVMDSKLGIYLHDGFKKSTDELYTDLKPLVEPYRDTYKINITGHSLGASMAAILMMYMQKDEYEIDKIITFGQPKVTNKNGADKYQNTALLRVVDKEDPVPLLPGRTHIEGSAGHYRHFGKEIILLDNEFFVLLEKQKAQAIKTSSLWANLLNERLKDHMMSNYLQNIKSKLEGSTKVPYSDRLSYE